MRLAAPQQLYQAVQQPARDINRDHFHRINSVSVRRDPPHCGFPPMRIVFPRTVYLSAGGRKINSEKS